MILIQTNIDPSPAVQKIVETGIIGSLLIIVTFVLMYTIYCHNKERKEERDKRDELLKRHEDITQNNINILQQVSNKFSDSLDRNTQVLNEIKGMIKH